MIYLYIKTHNTTGLKYLGKTIQEDPHSYSGSGKDWKKHLKKYGNDVSTEILFKTEDKEEFKRVALKYSHQWNIVESSEFANRTLEEGQGGYTSYTKERNEKISKSLKGRNAYWVKKGVNKGKVVARNVETNETLSVTQEEFANNPSLVGIGSVNAGKPKSKKWRDDMKKFYRENPRKGNIVEYDGKQYPSANALGRALGFAKGRIRGMINRGEATIIST